MNLFKSRHGALLFAALLINGAVILPAGAAQRAAAAPTATSAAATAAPKTNGDDASTAASAAPAETPDIDEPEQTDRHRGHDWRERLKRRHGRDNALVAVGHDVNLPAGETADSVVAVLGSASSAGEAGDVVSVFGDTRVTGPISGDAVAVLGNTYIDNRVDGEAVAVLGNMELGPHAEIRGDVVDVGGTLLRDPAAIVHGGVRSVEGAFGGFTGLRAWIKDCLLYGRPLAFESEVAWAWYIAIGFLVLYAGLALLFRGGVTRCVRTFDTQPGISALAALLSVLFTPILLVLLCITVIGIPAVPFVVFGLFCASLFGKAVMLAWLGHRCLAGRTTGALGEPVLWVLIGGAIALLLYVVPILGMLVYQLLNVLGLGVVVLTLIQSADAHRAARAVGTGAAAGAATGAATGAAIGTAGAAATDTATGAAADAAAFAAAQQSAGEAPQAAQRASASVAAPIAATLPRAGFWIRMIALLLDAILIGILTHLLGHENHLQLVGLAIYGAVMWKLRGSTVGGILFDLQVVRVDGREMDWPTAVIRALSCFLSLVVAGLGFFWIAFDADKQGWHDKIAGTVVVRVPKGRSLV
ncbi:MAG: RDD family protein [Steroidobacteraceae bacterium]|jgi:uncharacterized RDD family membrane protein YckC